MNVQRVLKTLAGVDRYPIRMRPVKINAYTCGTCTITTTTVDIHEGVTPFLYRCPHCGDMAESHFYPSGPIPAHLPPPTVEWYKPDARELKSFPMPIREHVSKGGLLDRDIPAEHKTIIEAEFTARGGICR